jgi:hypothetical protein
LNGVGFTDLQHCHATQNEQGKNEDRDKAEDLITGPGMFLKLPDREQVNFEHVDNLDRCKNKESFLIIKTAQ